jgi:hypothetical protein
MRNKLYCILCLVVNLQIYGQERHLEINDYINRIVEISYDNLPVKNYREKFIIVFEDITYFHISAYYYNEDGKDIYFDPHAEDFPFFSLQEATYDHNRGYWWKCIILVNNDGKYSVEYNYDVPEWVQEFREKDIK